MTWMWWLLNWLSSNVNISFLHFILFYFFLLWIWSHLPHNSLTSHDCFGLLCMLGHLPDCPETHSSLNIWLHVNTQMLCRPDNPWMLWVVISSTQRTWASMMTRVLPSFTMFSFTVSIFQFMLAPAANVNSCSCIFYWKWCLSRGLSIAVLC